MTYETSTVRHKPTGRIGTLTDMNVAGLAGYAPDGFVWVEHVDPGGVKWKTTYRATTLEEVEK